MDYTVVVCAIASLLIFSSPINARKSISQSPAPAPSPSFVNLTDLLTLAGPYATFLKYTQSTEVIDTFQNQANNTDGITLFVPNNEAFSKQKNPSLSNLTTDQLKSLCLFHGLAFYYTLADFNNLTQVKTFAGTYLNVTDDSGTVNLNSGWTRTKITSAVLSTRPVAVYEVKNVLLPESIFGTNIPPTQAPAPSPVAPSSSSPAADAPGSEKGDNGDLASSPASTPSSSHKVMMSFGPLSFLAMVSASLFFS